jgi:hypothetical protein
VNVDPNSSNGNKPDGDKSSRDAHVDITVTSLDGLLPPPRSAAGYRVRDLFKEGTPEAYAEIGDILYFTESRPVRAYIGYRTAAEISPKTVPLAMDILRLHSLASTEEFLSILAQREYGAFMLGGPPALKGDVFAGLRAKIADVAVSPECYFAQKDWERRSEEILSLTTYPITILRACAGPEIEPILIAAATRGGLDSEMNRRALDMLLLREESDPNRRVLSAGAVKAISRATDDLFREPFNRMQLVELLDAWLSKETPTQSEAEREIRDHLVQQWLEYRSSACSVSPGDAPRVFDTIRLLRHFKDPLSQQALREAMNDSHIGISLFAGLCVSGGTGDDLTAISSALQPQASSEDTLRVLRVFGYRVSSEVDAKLWPLFREYIHRTWVSDVTEGGSRVDDVAQRLVVLQNILRRFYTERFDSPFLEKIFSTVGSDDTAMATLAVNTFVQAVKVDRLPPATFYDRPEKLSSLQAAIRILSKAGREKGNDTALQLAIGVQELFVLKGPAAYGFELAESEGEPAKS